MISPLIAPVQHPIRNFRASHQNRTTTPETCLAITLRFLAGGSYLDICFAFGIDFDWFFHQKGPL